MVAHLLNSWIAKHLVVPLAQVLVVLRQLSLIRGGHLVQLASHHEVKPAKLRACQVLAPIQMIVKASQQLDLVLIKV